MFDALAFHQNEGGGGGGKEAARGANRNRTTSVELIIFYIWISLKSVTMAFRIIIGIVRSRCRLDGVLALQRSRKPPCLHQTCFIAPLTNTAHSEIVTKKVQ